MSTSSYLHTGGLPARRRAAERAAAPGGAGSCGTVPPSLNAHTLSPRFDNWNELPPASSATYCSPFTSYVAIGASAPVPVWKRHSGSPFAMS